MLAMTLKVLAIEKLKARTCVSLLFNDSNQIMCRKSLPSEPPDAIAKRDIGEGESVIFDTGQDTNDLLRPRSNAYVPDWH